jgi:hypothetical protein
MPVFLHFASDYDKSVQELNTQTVDLRQNPRRERRTLLWDANEFLPARPTFVVRLW